MSRIGAINNCKRVNELMQKHKLSRLCLKKMLNSLFATTEQKYVVVRSLIELPRMASSVRLRNRCAITGRPRGYYRFFGLSRIMIKQMTNSSLLPGMAKSS